MLEFITIANITDDGSSNLIGQIQTSPTVNPIFSGTIFTDKDGSVSRNSTTISDKVFSDITQVLIAAESSKGYDIHNGIPYEQQ